MTAPSTNVWNASPTITSDAALLVCTSHSCVSWQCRQMHQFLEQKERENADEQRAERMRRRNVVERFGQQREQRDAEQRADGVADQPRNELDAEVIAEKQEGRRRQQAAEAAEDAQPYRGRIDMCTDR